MIKHLRRVLGYFVRDWAFIGFGLGLIVLGIATNLLKPWPLEVIIDRGLAPGTQGAGSVIALMAGALLALHLLTAGINAAQTYIMVVIGQRGAARVRCDLFRKLQRLPMRSHARMPIGDMIYRVTGDTYAFQTWFQHGLVTGVTALITLCGMLGVLWTIDRHLMFASLAVVPLLLVVMRKFSGRMTHRASITRQAESAMTSQVQQVMSAMPLVRAYVREESEERRFANRSEDALRSRLSQLRIETLYWMIIAVLIGTTMAVVTALGAMQVRRGELTIGQLTVALAYVASLFDPINTISSAVSTLNGASAGVQRVVEVLDQPEEVRDKPGAVRPGSAGRARGEVEFRQVRFGYEPGHEVLRGIDLRIAPGQSVAVIGPSGVGKTSLLQLLPRFYDPVSGAVLLDGRDIRSMSLRSVRENVSVMLQDSVLMPVTIGENIAYGRPDATWSEIVAAARAANADSFISRLPRGYDTLIGEGGAKLSGGERQRISIARAFLKDAPVLALDEPTTALDSESEAAIVDALRRLMKDRAVLVVAHRLTTIRCSNVIAVLQHGSLVEVGTPGELQQRGGYYARVLERQAAG